MRLLCISDEVDPIVYSPRIRERFGDVDAVLAAGDLPMEYISYVVTVLNKPLFFVFGNHNLIDLPYYRPRLRRHRHEFSPHDRAWGGIYAGFKVVREAGLIVMGLGGTLRYNDGLNQFSQLGMWLRALALGPALLYNRLRYGRYLDILLTHAPPRGIHDRNDRCHQGFGVFLWLMKAFKPRYLVHGHVHLYDANDHRITRYGDTTVVNAFGHFRIDEDGDSD